jgi:hypothetical protein
MGARYELMIPTIRYEIIGNNADPFGWMSNASEKTTLIALERFELGRFLSIDTLQLIIRKLVSSATLLSFCWKVSKTNRGLTL